MILLPSADLDQFGVRATGASNLVIRYTDIGGESNRYQDTAISINSSSLTIENSNLYSGVFITTQRRGIRIENRSVLRLNQTNINVIGNNSVTGISNDQSRLESTDSVIAVLGNVNGGNKIGINALTDANTVLNNTDITIEMTTSFSDPTLIGVNALSPGSSVTVNGGTFALNANSAGGIVTFGNGSSLFNGTTCIRNGMSSACN